MALLLLGRLHRRSLIDPPIAVCLTLTVAFSYRGEDGGLFSNLLGEVQEYSNIEHCSRWISRFSISLTNLARCKRSLAPGTSKQRPFWRKRN